MPRRLEPEPNQEMGEVDWRTHMPRAGVREVMASSLVLARVESLDRVNSVRETSLLRSSVRLVAASILKAERSSFSRESISAKAR